MVRHGALRAVYPDIDYPEHRVAENPLDPAAKIDIFKFNDQGDHHQLMQAFGLARQACESLASAAGAAPRVPALTESVCPRMDSPV